MVKTKGGYDRESDVFYLKLINKNYKYSEQYQNFIIDRDDIGNICGFEILEVSKFLDIPKYQLDSSISAQIGIEINSNKIKIKMEFKILVRNSEKISSFMFNDINSLNLTDANQNLAFV